MHFLFLFPITPSLKGESYETYQKHAWVLSSKKKREINLMSCRNYVELNSVIAIP